MVLSKGRGGLDYFLGLTDKQLFDWLDIHNELNETERRQIEAATKKK